MKLDFNMLKDEVLAILGEGNVMVLATSSDNCISARSMSCVIDRLNILFQTDKTFNKYDQIDKNPNVALCYNNVQIEGRANIKKHPFEEENTKFLELFKKNYKASFNTYSHMKNEVVIEVEPKKITLWKYIDNKPYRDILYIDKDEAIREFYDTTR
jgi:general stress protein 26